MPLRQLQHHASLGIVQMLQNLRVVAAGPLLSSRGSSLVDTFPDAFAPYRHFGCTLKVCGQGLFGCWLVAWSGWGVLGATMLGAISSHAGGLHWPPRSLYYGAYCDYGTSSMAHSQHSLTHVCLAPCRSTTMAPSSGSH